MFKGHSRQKKTAFPLDCLVSTRTLSPHLTFPLMVEGLSRDIRQLLNFIAIEIIGKGPALMGNGEDEIHIIFQLQYP